MKKFFKRLLAFCIMLSGPAALSSTAFYSETHEDVTAKSIQMFENSFQDVADALCDTDFKNQLKSYCVEPDLDENDFSIWENHFYNTATGKNFRGKDNTALKYFLMHYNKAIESYGKGKKYDAYEKLGRALHFLEDLCTPVHTNNQNLIDSAVDSAFHISFEKKCIELHDAAKASMALKEFDYYKNNTVETIAKKYASISNNIFYAMTKKIMSEEEAAIKSMENAQKAVAGIIYKFSLDASVARKSAKNFNNNFCTTSEKTETEDEATKISIENAQKNNDNSIRESSLQN